MFNNGHRRHRIDSRFPSQKSISQIVTSVSCSHQPVLGGIILKSVRVLDIAIPLHSYLQSSLILIFFLSFFFLFYHTLYVVYLKIFTFAIISSYVALWEPHFQLRPIVATILYVFCRFRVSIFPVVFPGLQLMWFC